MSDKAQKPALINIIWLILILIAIISAAFTGRMEELTKASFEKAKSAVNLAIGLIGAMSLWLGIMKVAEEGGLLKKIARLIKPLMVRLFPDIPAEHPAMSSIIMNIAANILGLGNAATPLGIKAMKDLNSFNPQPHTATNSMCLFLAINTSSVTLLPLGVMAVRSAAGSASPASILIPTLFATLCSTMVAILMARFLSRLPAFANTDPLVGPQNSDNVEPGADSKSGISAANFDDDPKTTSQEEKKSLENEPEKDCPALPLGPVRKILITIFLLLGLAALFFRLGVEIKQGRGAEFAQTLLSFWMIPFLMAFLLLYGYSKGINVYETFTAGAKEGFKVAITIIPFLVAILVAVGMFRVSGALELLVTLLSPLTSVVGMPAEVLPMAFLRPLSGTGAFGVMSEIVSHAPDSFSSFLASTMQGSTETTFYVLAVYFGAVQIRKTRHALHACLLADLAGIVAAVFICNIWF